MDEIARRRHAAWRQRVAAERQRQPQSAPAWEGPPNWVILTLLIGGWLLFILAPLISYWMTYRMGW